MIYGLEITEGVIKTCLTQTVERIEKLNDELYKESPTDRDRVRYYIDQLGYHAIVRDILIDCLEKFNENNFKNI